MYDGGDVVVIFDNTGAWQHRYLHGDAVDQVFMEESVGEILWGLADNQGTIRDVANYDPLNDTSAVLNHRRFNAFGGITSESNAGIEFRYAYTGRYFDEDTGLQYNRRRWYDAETARFLSIDPILLNSGESNFYRYTGNGPTNRTDPSGLDFVAVQNSDEGRWAYWQIEEDGFWANYNRAWWTLGDVKGTTIYLQDRFGGGTVPLKDVQKAAKNFWKNHGDISKLPESSQIHIIREVLHEIKRKYGPPTSTYASMWKREFGTDVKATVEDLREFGGNAATDIYVKGPCIQAGVASGAAGFRMRGSFKGMPGPSGRVSTQKYFEKRWDKATFGTVEKSIEYHVGKHGKGLSAVQYTQRAMQAFRNSQAVRTVTTDIQGRSAIAVRAPEGNGLFTPHGRIIWFHPR